MSTTKIPHNPEAEESVLGAMLLSRPACEVATEILTSGDFYSPINGNIFAAIEYLYEQGEPIDAVTVTNCAKQRGLSIGLDPAIFITLQASVPSISNARHYAQIIETASVGRQVMHMAQEALGAVTSGADPFEVNDELSRALLGIGTTEVGQEAKTISEWEQSADAIGRTIIPGLLKVDHRVIIVARPGSGKSSLLKFMGMSAAQGLQPFTRQEMTPIRVLAFDYENPLESALELASPFDRFLRDRSPVYDESRFKLVRRVGGTDLSNRRDRADFQREIALHKPDLVTCGPIYNMTTRGASESWEAAADNFTQVIDSLRVKYDFATIIEGHAPKTAKESKELTPQGSARFMQWPDVGIALNTDGEPPFSSWYLDRFRGDRLQGLRWPKSLRIDRTGWLYEAIF